MQQEKTIDCGLKKPLDLKEIGRLLKQARRSEGLTQAQLADELDVDVMTVSLAENGSKRTGKNFLNKIAIRLNVTFDLTFPFDK